MDFETAIRLIGYDDEDFSSISLPTQTWLIAEVEDVIARHGAGALKGPDGDIIRAVFDGGFPPDPVRPSSMSDEQRAKLPKP